MKLCFPVWPDLVNISGAPQLVLVLKVPRSVAFVDEGHVRLLTLEQSLDEVGKLFGCLVVY